MKKFILSVVMLATLHIAAKAQMPYNVTASTATYQPLTGGTLVSGTKAWNEDSIHIIQIPFSFKVDTQVVSRLILSGGSVAVFDTGNTDGFALIGTNVMDRGITTVDTSSKSPVRYSITGTAGSRILKIELANVGFSEEYAINNTLTDSANFQIWLYETSNVVELHFGDAQVADFNGYFPIGLFTGFMKNINVGMGTFDKFYILTGSTTAPVVDSMTQSTVVNGMSSYPVSGTVYRFTPKGNTTSILANNKLVALKVYPTQCHDVVTVDNPNNDALNYSVVDMRGSVLQVGTLQSGSNRVDVSALAAGMYLLKVDDGVYGAVKRIVKL